MKQAKSSDQSGFAVVEAILIVVIVALLGFVGWYVVRAKHNADTSLQNASNSVPATSSAKSGSSTTKTATTGGTDNASLQQDLNGISSSQSQESADNNSASNGLNDSSQEITVPTN